MTQPKQAGASPFACVIPAAILVVFGGLAAVTAVIYFVQKRAYGDFTGDQPAPIPVFAPSPGQAAQALAKLEAVRKATAEEKIERILFSADDINSLIATVDLLKDFRGNTLVEKISQRGMETRMSQPVRKMVFSKERRYLNATFIFLPELRRRTIALRVADILPDQGTIPREFVKNYDTLGFFKLDPELPAIKAAIPRLSRVYLEDGNLVVETGTPASEQSPFGPKGESR